MNRTVLVIVFLLAVVLPLVFGACVTKRCNVVYESGKFGFTNGKYWNTVLVMGVNMRKLSLSADSGVFEGYIDLYVSSRDILEKMIKKLSSIEGIENVSRTAI